MTAVLMYHGVGETPAAHGERRYTVSRQALARHLDLLRGRYPVLGYEEMLDGRAPRGTVVLTFDDGEASVFAEALPELKARHVTATVFITTAWIDTPGYLTGTEILRLRDEGWTIGAHGATHRYLSDLDDAALEQELAGSREALEHLLGKPVRHMSLPGGRTDPRVSATARRLGYRSLCTSQVGCHEARDPLMAIPRLMVQRGFGDRLFLGLAGGRPLAIAALAGRQALLGGAKRLLGNRAYDQLRGLARRP